MAFYLVNYEKLCKKKKSNGRTIVEVLEPIVEFVAFKKGIIGS